MITDNSKLFNEIFKYQDQVDRIYKGLVLFHTNLNGETDMNCRFNANAFSIEEKKQEIEKIYSMKSLGEG